MVAWRDPVVFHSKYPTTGSFTLEGSRPGTAAAAVWAAHKSVTLDQSGYGRLHAASIENSRLVRHKLKAIADGQPFTITMLFADEVQDLNIMSYAFNPGGNRDPVRANDINEAIYARLAIEYKGDPRPPVIITGSKLDPAEFGHGLVRRLRREMGVKDDGSPLAFLMSTIMNPFLAEGTIDRLIAAMRDVVAEECLSVIGSSP